MDNKSKKPKVRFQGFSDEWVEENFLDLFVFLQNNSLSRDELNYKQGCAYNVHYGDVLIKFGAYIDIKSDILPLINDENIITKYKKSLLNNGDIIIADAAEDLTVGKCSEIIGITNEIVISGLHTIPCRPIISFEKFYLGYSINSESYHNKLIPLIQGTKVSSVSKFALSNTSLIYPKSLDEQQKIGDLFQNLDNLINQKQKKYDKLVTLKKSMLQKMFPKKGSKYPEIRFEGFSDEWEEKTLGQLMEVGSVKRIHQSDWTDIGIRFLRARDIVAKFKNENIVDKLYISKEKYSEYTGISGKVRCGDLLVTGVGTIGVPMLIADDEPIYFKDGNIIWFKNENIIDGKFLFYSFTGDIIQDFIVKAAGTGTVGTYTIESGRCTRIYLPNKKEQQKIGEYFQNLDNLISLQQKEIEKLKNIKKSLLENMFV